MANILLCAEFLTGTIPLNRLADCAVELIAQGHAVYLLTSDIARAHRMSEFEKVAIFPAPHFVSAGLARQDQVSQKPIKIKPLKNYSSLLMARGYADSSTLEPVLRSWLHFMATLDTDFVFADDSPTALLAARLLKVPSVMIGKGFSVPPRTQPLTSASPWRESRDGAIQLESNCFSEDRRMLASVNSAIKNLGFHDAGFDEAKDFFSDTVQWVVSLPELDHYGVRDVQYVARWQRDQQDVKPVWPLGSGRKVFVIMDINTPHVTELLIQLTAIGDPVLAVIQDASDEFISQYKADNLYIQRNKVKMEAVLEQCNTIINHGCHDLVYELLLLGTPCILMPSCHESTLLSYRLARQKLCFAGPVMTSKLNVVGLLKAAREQGVEWENAAALAHRYTTDNSLGRLHDLIAEKLPHY